MESTKNNKNVVVDDEIVRGKPRGFSKHAWLTRMHLLAYILFYGRNSFDSALFQDVKNSTSKVTDNKYFDLKKFSSQNSKETGKDEPRAKVTMKEWLESLTVEERVLAVSTIFVKHKEVLDEIRNDINNCTSDLVDLEGQSYRDRFSTSNNAYLQRQFMGTSISSGYTSLNTYPSSGGFLSRYVTFLDTYAPEDTLTLHEDILKNVDGFFDILESCK